MRCHLDALMRTSLQDASKGWLRGTKGATTFARHKSAAKTIARADKGDAD